MKPSGYLLIISLVATSMLAATTHAFSQKPVSTQSPADSTFSVFVNSSISFTHANDPHINKWLAKYHYPTEPHIPSSLNIEVAAMPVASRLMFSVKLSTIISGHNLSSFNLLGGLYTALVKHRNLLILIGAGAGFHRDIITLNGDMPADYKELAQQYNKQLSLHRGGLSLEPALRAFWFPVTLHQLQLGLFAGLGLDMEFNSPWKLGYYDSNHGEYGRFRKLKKPADQQRVSEHGLAVNAGLSLHLHIQ